MFLRLNGQKQILRHKEWLQRSTSFSPISDAYYLLVSLVYWKSRLVMLRRHTDVPLTQILESDNDRKKRAVYMTNQRVVNQEHVVNEIYEVLSSERPIITKRPRGSFLLVGPTGVGKREIAKAVALHWYCDANRIVEIDISEYADLLPMKSAAPPPYDFLPFGSESKEKHLLDRLTQVVAKRPYSVILLSKIDNDPLTVTRVLLRILSDDDNALSSNTKGNVVDFSQCIIFLTSNVGPDQLVSSCNTCYKNHDCSYLKDSVEMTKFIDEFKILVVERFDDEKAVARVLLRELVTEAYGNGCIVHASDAALDALLIIAHKPRLGEGGNAIKQTLIKHVMSKVAVAKELDKKVVLCVDTWVGSRKLSFRIYSPEQSVADRYFKFKAGTADEYIAHLKKTVGALDKVFHLQRRFLDLSESGESLSSLRELVVEAFRGLLASHSPCGPPLICAFKQIEESCHRLPTTEDKRKLESVIRSLQSLETSTGKVTSSIIDVLLKTGDSQLEMPSLQRRNYMFGGLNRNAKTKLIACLTQSLGESFFTYIKLHDNYRGGEKEKASLMGKVNKNPCMVVFVDGVEFADDIFYKSLLDIFDNGVLEDCEGFGFEFRRSIIILTSELLANTPRNTAAVYFKDRRNDVSIQPFNQEEDVFKEESFRTELLHRLDEIVFFDPEGGNASFMPISAAAHSHYVDNYHFSLLSSPMQLSSPFESSSMQQHSRL
ncbi:hypothetical protein ABFS82_02G043100 [Erythranthe guttata]